MIFDFEILRADCITRVSEQYHISSIISRVFSLPKHSQTSRSILYDGSRSLELFRKVKTRTIAKFHRTDLRSYMYLYSF